jgi:hypothetical protein
MTSASSPLTAPPWAWCQRADGVPVPIGDPDEDEGYGDDDEDEDDEDDDDEEPWQVAGAAADDVRMTMARIALRGRVQLCVHRHDARAPGPAAAAMLD